jgi:hypothetical protein
MVCKTVFIIVLLTLCVKSAMADVLPPGVPNPIGPDGKQTDAIMFTTPAYIGEATRLVLLEANKVASELKLADDLPITKENAQQIYISPFGMCWVDKTVGNVETANYIYYVSQDDKFSYLEGTHQNEDSQKYMRQYQWPVSEIDTNFAYQQATQWLSAVSMDVNALNRDFHLIITVDTDFVKAPSGKFVPIYYVAWCKKWKPVPGIEYTQTPEWDSVASVRFFAPTKTLMQLRVEDPKYILRSPLVFTNLAELLLGTNSTTRVIPQATFKPHPQNTASNQVIELYP